ncbi:phage baseplate protein, partial [Klebsiella pneumoniae]
VTNDVTAGGKSLMTHTHGGVEHGNDSTGEPE